MAKQIITSRKRVSIAVCLLEMEPQWLRYFKLTFMKLTFNEVERPIKFLIQEKNQFRMRNVNKIIKQFYIELIRKMNSEYMAFRIDIIKMHRQDDKIACRDSEHEDDRTSLAVDAKVKKKNSVTRHRTFITKRFPASRIRHSLFYIMSLCYRTG